MLYKVPLWQAPFHNIFVCLSKVQMSTSKHGQTKTKTKYSIIQFDKAGVQYKHF